jgi:pimeloyl-ACP methyl ester carboxylesterase
MPFLTVGKENSGDIALYYEDHGAGQPVVLIHGYPLSGRAWERQLPPLLDAGYRVITYDRRGFGQSSQCWSGFDYDTFAADLQALIATLGLRDVVLVGHSMGTGELARYMRTYGTSRVSRAVFISGLPPYLRKAPDNPEGVDASLFEGIKKAVLADRPAYLAQFCFDFFNFDILNGRLVSEHVVRESWNISVAASPKGVLDCVDAWGTDFREDLRRIDIPALVIHGDADRIVPFAASGKRMPAVLKESRLVVIEGGPHGIAWTHADHVNRELMEFLGQAATGARAA